MKTYRLVLIPAKMSSTGKDIYHVLFNTFPLVPGTEILADCVTRAQAILMKEGIEGVGK